MYPFEKIFKTQKSVRFTVYKYLNYNIKVSFKLTL